MHTAQLMPLPLTVSCFSKIRIGFTFLVPAHPGSPGKRAVKHVFVCVCVRVCVVNACFCCVRFRFFPIPSQEIGLGKRLRNDLFCVEWDVKPQLSQSVIYEALYVPLASTPPGMPGTHPPQYFGWGDVNGNIPPQYYYVLLDIADQYWLPSVRSASSRFHSAIRRHQFASVRQVDSRRSVVRPP